MEKGGDGGATTRGALGKQREGAGTWDGAGALARRGQQGGQQGSAAEWGDGGATAGGIGETAGRSRDMGRSRVTRQGDRSIARKGLSQTPTTSKPQGSTSEETTQIKAGTGARPRPDCRAPLWGNPGNRLGGEECQALTPGQAPPPFRDTPELHRRCGNIHSAG